jgi:uncharacterized protein (TIGR02301 family)
MRTLVLIVALSVASLAATAGPARAQGGPVPFEDDLARLSEILGGLHYLRAVCGADEKQTWRAEMQALIDAEAPAGSPRRAKMVASFNRGFRGFQQAYRTCTPAAELAIRRHLAEGAKISREVTARYSN